ncbi:LysE family translocator [Acuticoccus kandeliae]|uniref:LysE family translocator n=1 Tax=Acuticoccus kandeliae TaxID=2073160 RepID=UPI000D3EDCE6|nr:LysE family translocator [Acuticoccus kandeliae]
MSVEFLLTSLVVCLVPGIGVIYTLAVALGRGFVPAVAAAFGCTLAIVPHVVASSIGLAALLHTSALAFQTLKYLGVLYLLFMAWRTLRETGALAVSEDRSAKSLLKTVTDGILLNVLNPKLSLFFLAFLPQFVPAGVASPASAMATLGLAFMAMTFAVFVTYGAAASLARSYVLSRPAVVTWLRRGFAAAFGFIGLRLAFSNS